MSRENCYEHYLQEEEPETIGQRMRDSIDSHHNPSGDQSMDHEDFSFKSRRNGPKLKPELYDGGEDFEAYFDQFECIADLGGWTQKERALTLAACLRGQARRFYVSLSVREKSCYQPLAFQLRQRFGTSSRHSLYWSAKFENRFRQAGEKIATFSDELLILARKAHPHLDNATQHHLALQQWYKSMSPEVKWRCMERNCTTIREAEEVADMYETIMRSNERKKGVFMVQEEEKSTTPRPEGKSASWNKPLCYCCQSPSHRLMSCPVYKNCKEREEQWKSSTPAYRFSYQNGRNDQRRANYGFNRRSENDSRQL